MSTTRPATQPVAQLPAESPIRHWFAQLCDADPHARQQARIDLMGMSLDDLPAFHQLVSDSRPLAPSQTAVLHDIVNQVYLAGQKYQGSGGESDTTGAQGPFFLGVSWNNESANVARLGGPVDQRLPGFPANRFLRNGDMIMGIYINPELSLGQPPNVETHTQSAISEFLKQINPPVRYIALEILRDGEQIRVPIRLAPRPVEADLDRQTFTQGREQMGQSYWDENFAPLFANSDALCAD